MLTSLSIVTPAFNEEASIAQTGIRENERAIDSTYRRALSWTYAHLVRGLGAPIGDPGSIELGRRALLDVARRPVDARSRGGTT